MQQIRDDTSDKKIQSMPRIKVSTEKEGKQSWRRMKGKREGKKNNSHYTLGNIHSKTFVRINLPMALMAVTCKSSGRQSWNDSSLSDETVISSFSTEFTFILQSETVLNFLIWREVPSRPLASTLHDTTQQKGTERHQRFICLSSRFFFTPTNVWTCFCVTNVSNRTFHFSPPGLLKGVHPGDMPLLSAMTQQ